MKHSILRYLTVLIILSISGFRLNAQNTALVLDASSFKPVQQDAITGVSVDKIEKDRSNRECARIKLHLNRMTPEEIAQVGIRALGGNVIVMKKTVAHGGNGIIFEMTARPGVRFYITHPSLGESNTVMVDLEGNREYAMEGWSEQKYSVTIECNRTGAEVYLDGTYRGVIGANGMLTLTEVAVGDHTIKMKDGADEAEQKINVSMNRIYFPVSLESHQQYVVFQVKPLNASVELDGMVLDVVDGAAFANKHFGTYEYTVRAPKHHTYTGSVIVNDLVNKHIVSVDLLPAYGWIEIADNGASNGADVYLDDEYMGKVPFKSKELASGQHRIRITKPMYKPFQASVSVKDNETTLVVPQLIANFANITLEVADDAEIWVNGTIKGKGRWNGAMTIGPNKVETRKPGHRTQTMSYEVTALMEGQKLTLKTPEAILGTLVVESTPPISDVYIDGKLFSQTPVRTHLPVGAHQVRIARKGYKDYQTSVTITEGQVITVSHSLEAAGNSQPVRKETEVKPSQGRKQNINVTGVVRGSNGEPLMGVAILVKGTNKGTITDINGEFYITVQTDDIIEFASIGYKTQRIPVEGRRSISVVMKKDEKYYSKWKFEPYFFTGRFWLNDSFPESGSFSGWEAGVMARYNFNRYLGLQAGLAFNAYTAGSDSTTGQMPDYTEVTFQNLRLPLQLTAALQITSDINISIEAGAYAGYAIGGKIRYTMEGTDGGPASEGTYPMFPADKELQPFNRFDFGLQFGAKFYIYGVGIGGSYIMGLNHFAKSPSVGSRTRAYGLSVSYAF